MILIGPHVIQSSVKAQQWSRKAGIVKQINGTDLLKLAPVGAITIYRKFYADQSFGPGRGEAIARDIITSLGGFRPTYVELFNEIAPHLGGGLEDHVKFTREASRVLHDAHLAVAGFSFATGNPEKQDWEYIQAQSFGNCDVLAIHAYWGKNGPKTSIWNALRYRLVHQWLRGYHPRFAISEAGLDAVEINGAPGWKLAGLSADQYFQQLMEFNDELVKDVGMVIGATIFTVGPTPDWEAFSVDELVDRFPSWKEDKPLVPTRPLEKFPVSYIVIHDTEGCVDCSWWFGQDKVSCSYYVRQSGEVCLIVPLTSGAVHAGYGVIPGFNSFNKQLGYPERNLNGASWGIELEADAAPADPGYTMAQLDALVRLLKSLTTDYGIARQNIYCHSEVDANAVSQGYLASQAHHDPRPPFNKEAVLARVFTPQAPTLPKYVSFEGAVKEQVRVNPDAWLFNYIVRKKDLPVSNEFELEGYICQKASTLDGKAQYFVACPKNGPYDDGHTFEVRK